MESDLVLHFFLLFCRVDMILMRLELEILSNYVDFRLWWFLWFKYLPPGIRNVIENLMLIELFLSLLFFGLNLEMKYQSLLPRINFGRQNSKQDVVFWFQKWNYLHIIGTCIMLLFTVLQSAPQESIDRTIIEKLKLWFLNGCEPMTYNGW